jgi:glycosyltransferase involved in cell wall biosynthesis
MKFEISFILPGYNVVNYVRDCIESILRQPIQNIEIIYVDDVSTDHTADVVREMALKDNRIKMVEHSQNKGSYAARNTGMQLAQGKWIIFLDPDDILSPNFGQSLGAFLNDSTVNLITYDYESFNDGEDLPKVSHAKNPVEVLEIKQLLQRKDFAWLKLIRTSWLRKTEINFHEGKTMWDILFHWQICIKAEKAIYIKENLIWYRQRSTASSYRNDWYRAEGFSVMDKLREFLANSSQLEIYEYELTVKELNLFYDIYTSFLGKKDLVKQALVEVKKRITPCHWSAITKAKNFDKKKKNYLITFFRPKSIPWSLKYLPSNISGLVNYRIISFKRILSSYFHGLYG